MNDSGAPTTKRRWCQYSLRTLFVVMTLFAIACSWYAYEMRKAAKRRKAIAEIVKLGGEVDYYDADAPPSGYGGEPPGWFSWLRRVHGDEHLGRAVCVNLSGPKITDDELVNLKDLTNLKGLWLYNTQVTDAGLVHLEGLTNLKGLLLCNTQVTDAGLVHLKGLSKLDRLDFDGTEISDAGLVHLNGFTKLKRLDICLTRITDAGLVHLKGLSKLDRLSLDMTRVTDEGVKKLQEALPNCKIHH